MASTGRTSRRRRSSLWKEKTSLDPVLKGIPSDSGLRGIVGMVPNWTRLAKELGVPDDDIETYGRNSEPVAGLESLKHWRDAKTKNPMTWEFLLARMKVLPHLDMKVVCELEKKIVENKEWTRPRPNLPHSIFKQSPTDTGLKGIRDAVSDRWEELAKAMHVPAKLSRSEKALQYWRDGIKMHCTKWEFLLEKVEQMPSLGPTTAQEIEEAVENNPKWTVLKRIPTDEGLRGFIKAVGDKWLELATVMCIDHQQGSLQAFQVWRDKGNPADWEFLLIEITNLSCLGQIKADEIKNKIKKNPQWTETCQVLEGTPTDAGLQGFISFVSSKWEEFAEAVGISQQKSQTKFEVLQEWRDAEYPTHWEFLMDNIKALSTLSPNKVAEIDDKIKNDPNWSDYSPFRNKATSEALNWTSDNVWSRSDKVQTCSSYHKWLENMVKDNEFTDDIYGREKVALCGLNWFRNKYKEDNKIAMSEAIPPFSEDIDRPQDLFAIIAYKFGFEDSDYIKYTLFAALLHELHGKKFDTSTFFYGDYHVLHFACYCGKRRIVQLLMDWGVDADVRSPYSGMNALHIACGSNFVTNHYASFHIQMVDLLIENGANLFAETTDEGWVPLFKAIYAQKQELVQHLLKKYADLEVCNVLLLLQQHDSEGNTALHLAARINNLVIVKQICSYAHKADEQQAERTKKPVTSQESVWFQLLTAENDAEQTPIHFAAKHTEECLKEMIERQNIGSHLAFWCAKEDTYGKCPLDYAAETAHKTTFEVLWKYVKACSPPQVASVGLDIKQLVRKKDIDWTLVKHRLQDIPSALIPTIVEETAGALEVSKNYKHKSPHQDLSLHEILRASPGARPKEHLDVVTEFLDATVFGDQVVLGKTFDSDVHGIYDETSVHRSLTLHALLTTDLPVWGHPAIKGWIRNKIHTFKPGWWILMLHLVFYLIFLGSLIGALYLAARPEISEVELLQQYIGTVQLEPEDMGRIFLESMVLLYTLGMLCQVISDFCGLAHHYFKLFTVYLRIVLVALVIALIICRAAASQGQWIVASLLFLTAVFLSTDYLIIFRFCNVYVLALWVIVRRDVLRFLVIATILTFAFSGGLYFALRAEQAPPNTTSAVVCVNGNATEGNSSLDCVSIGELSVLYAEEIFPLEILILRSLQTVTDGSIINYDIYGVYTILLYLSFIVIILLLMINALIAQISHSYDEAQEQAAQMSTYATARFLMITYPVCPWCIPPGHSNSEEDSNYYSGNWKCLKYLNYRRMACKCISGSEEIIWIKDSILKESQHNGMCCKFLKRFLRSVMIVLRAIFGAEGAVVAKTTSTINKDQCGNMIAMKRFDSLTNLMKEQQGIHMAHVSPQEVAINIDN